MNKANAYPDYFFKRLTDITPEDVRKMNVDILAVDLDNTLVKDFSYRISDESRQWVMNMKKEGFRVILVSNTFFHRGLYLSAKLGGIPFLTPANKPYTLPLKICAAIFHTDIKKIAMIGDQLFTDILCANNAGAVSVKTEPIEDEIIFASHFRRTRKKEKEYLREYKNSEQF